MEKTKDRAGVYQILGQMSLNAGDSKRGIQYLEKAVAENPKLMNAYIMIGNAYAKLDDFDRAIREYQTAIEKNPRAIQPNMLIATLYDRRQDYTKANEYYEKVLEINSTFSPAANNLAWNIAQNGGNLDVALRWAEKAREYDQHNPGVADTLGWVMYKRGIFDKAIGLLKESSEGFGNKNPQVIYHLGMAYYQSGQRSQARVTLTRALASGKFDGSDEAQKILSLIGG